MPLSWVFVVRPLGFEPRTCGLRGQQKLSRLSQTVSLTCGFSNRSVQPARQIPVCSSPFGAELGAKNLRILGTGDPQGGSVDEHRVLAG